MQTLAKTLSLLLLLSLCCTLCCATSRGLQQDEEPTADPTAVQPAGVEAAAVEPAAVEAAAVEPAAAVPQKPRCKWYPPRPRGVKPDEWTAQWPQSCMGTPVDSYCEATCLKGYKEWPINMRPRIYCDPQPDGTADWNRDDIRGKCVAYCPWQPQGIEGVSWPSNCTNGFIEGAVDKPWAPQSTCYGKCRDGYIGEPAPLAKCVKPENGTAPAEWQIIQGACKDNACDGVPQRIRGGYWPGNCSRMEVGSTCEAICNEGFVPEPVPRAKCLPPNETFPYAAWETTFTGICRDNVCNSMPPFSPNANWPFNCTNIEVGGTCTATCNQGFIGDPIPVATCTKPGENETQANWVLNVPDGCKDPTACRDDPCQDIAFAVAGSCAPTRGESPSTPGSGQFTCSCFDYYKWDARTKTCGRGNLLAFTVARPVDITQMGARKRAAPPTQAPEVGTIYKYGAKKPSDIGGARWISQDTTPGANLLAVAVADANTAWAVGSKGIIKRYDGNAWSVERPPTEGARTLHAVAALSRQKAWVGGAGGSALYYDGSKWVDVSVSATHSINAITAVSEPGGVETVLAAAGDERNPNKLLGYIYKWDGQKWGAPFVVENVTLRGVTALDRYGAWACGFTSRGPQSARGVIMSWDYANNTWTRNDINIWTNGYARFNSIVAVDYRHMYVAGYVERADQSGTEPTGLVVQNSAEFDQWPFPSWSMAGTYNVARFNAITGLAPSTTVAVGLFKDNIADQPPDGPSQFDWGYPAVSWQKYGFSDKAQKPNVSISYYQEVTGIGMKYV